jgi:hypothetical protein
MLTRDYRGRVLKILYDAKLPVDVENVRTRAKIGNWMTAKAVLLELALDGLVLAEKTSKSWVFTLQASQRASVISHLPSNIEHDVLGGNR